MSTQGREDRALTVEGRGLSRHSNGHLPVRGARSGARRADHRPVPRPACSGPPRTAAGFQQSRDWRGAPGARRRLLVAGQTRLVGDDDGLHAVADVELGQDAGDVRLHRGLLEEELCADLRVGQALGRFANGRPRPCEPGGEGVVRGSRTARGGYAGGGSPAYLPLHARRRAVSGTCPRPRSADPGSGGGTCVRRLHTLGLCRF